MALLGDDLGGRVLWAGEVQPELRRWAAWCALAVVGLWPCPREVRAWLWEALPFRDPDPEVGSALSAERRSERERLRWCVVEAGLVYTSEMEHPGEWAIRAAYATIDAHEPDDVHRNVAQAHAMAQRALEAVRPSVSGGGEGHAPGEGAAVDLSRDLGCLLLDAAAAGILAQHAPPGLTAAARAGDVAASAVAHDLALTLQPHTPELVPELVATLSRWRPGHRTGPHEPG